MRNQPSIPLLGGLSREGVKDARALLFPLVYGCPPQGTNCEDMSYAEWAAAANFGHARFEQVHGPVARLAWARGEDPTEWAATPSPRPGESIPAGYIVGVQDREPVTLGMGSGFEIRARAVVDFHLPLPKLERPKTKRVRAKGPVKAFFDEVARLRKLSAWGTDSGTDEVGIWRTFSRGCKPSDCHKLDNGLWSTPQLLNPGFGPPRQMFQFAWRLHPSYRGRCTALEFLEHSEREKILVTHEGYEFVWCWDGVDMPTENVWSMRIAGLHYALRKDGETLFTTTIKKEFIEAWEATKA